MSEDFLADPKDLLESARAMGLEGIIAKRADSPYVSQRTETWLKFKGSERQELVVLGFTDRSGATGEVGSLLLGYWEAGVLQYAGDVGTGWDSKTARALHEKLAPLKTEKPPVLPETIKPGRWSKRGARREQWVKPQVVVEVAFGGWTPDKRVRHAVFKGVRRDKAAQSVTREVPRDGPDGARSNVVKAGNAANTVPLSKRVKVSNPERVIDATSGLTKLDLVRYYESVAPWMLPHLAGRPLSLVRAPSGVAGQQFFQKHDEKSSIPGLKALDPTIWPGHPGLLEIDTAEGLVSAAQMNVVEFHTWNSTSKKLNTPDRMIFDLDPGEGVKWKSIQEAALLTRSLLSELGLESWLKTSGGKGLHVVVPIAPRRDYDTVRDFSAAIVQHLAQTIPARFVAKSGASNRVGKIYVDYLRNNFGQTTAAAFSARARPGLGVSMPIGWEDLESLKSASQWTIATAREYLSFQKDDPWKAYWTSSQLLTAPMKRLGFTPKARKA
jgi:bifunctional non-homologous end joining protein LigD